ncbi:MAG: Transcriptional regulator, TetR family protein [Myxococcales bacterium]|nr:Transcriptional regulator, TetR family protein [Myxococcales bacterium]
MLCSPAMPRRTVAAPKRSAPKEAPAGSRDKRRSPALRDERRAQLVTAARDVFGQKGYHAATVDDITRAAGVAKGTFYLYFDEKREVYYDLVRSFLQHVKDIGASVAREVHTPQEFFGRCEQAAQELVRVFIEHHKLARLTYRESMSLDPELERLLRDFYRDLARVEADNIRMGIELGLFRAVDPMICAYAHIGMVERVALALLHEESPPEPRTVVRELLSIAFEGLRKR